jgi:hypothetical protein
MIAISNSRSYPIAAPAALLAIVSLGLTPDLAIGSTKTNQRTRLIVMADMGNEPDEEQQMTHLLMYANRRFRMGKHSVTIPVASAIPLTISFTSCHSG